MGRLQLNNISVGYGNKAIMTALDLEVNDGELLCLLGPSGAGKTTLLKTIGGLIPPLHGSIVLNDMDVTQVKADKRDVVLLFQKALLFPFQNVLENIGFGLRMQKISSQTIAEKCQKVMELTELTPLASKKVDELSGGQQQRVALARALVLEPSILLLDEPLSSLDPDLRQKMQHLIRRLQQQTATTMLFVTHDQSEAFSMSDRIALLINGNIRQLDRPEKLFRSPASPDVATFLGNPNIIIGRVQNRILTSQNLSVAVNHPDSAHITATIRPEDIVLSDTELADGVPGMISAKQFEGTLTRFTIELGQTSLTALSFSDRFSPGQKIWLKLPLAKFHFFTTNDEAPLHNKQESP
jgi:ABC-type sugar transport system ATPase subunit